MHEVLYSGYIADDANENAGIDFAAKFANSGTIAFVMIAHQGSGSPSTAGVKVQLEHSDDGNVYEPVPNVVLSFSQPGAVTDLSVEIPPGTIKAFGKVTLVGTGTGNPAGAGAIVAVW